MTITYKSQAVSPGIGEPCTGSCRIRLGFVGVGSSSSDVGLPLSSPSTCDPKPNEHNPDPRPYLGANQPTNPTNHPAYVHAIPRQPRTSANPPRHRPGLRAHTFGGDCGEPTSVAMAPFLWLAGADGGSISFRAAVPPVVKSGAASAVVSPSGSWSCGRTKHACARAWMWWRGCGACTLRSVMATPSWPSAMDGSSVEKSSRLGSSTPTVQTYRGINTGSSSVHSSGLPLQRTVQYTCIAAYSAIYMHCSIQCTIHALQHTVHYTCITAYSALYMHYSIYGQRPPSRHGRQYQPTKPWGSITCNIHVTLLLQHTACNVIQCLVVRVSTLRNVGRQRARPHLPWAKD